MYTKPRDMISKVTPLPSTSLLRSMGHIQHQCEHVWIGPSDLIRGHHISGKSQCGTTGYNQLDTPYSQYYVKQWQMFLCSKTHYIDHHCPKAHCYKCGGFGHFTQHCPEKMSSSETPCHLCVLTHIYRNF